MTHGTGFRRIWWFPPLPRDAAVYEIGYGAGDFAREARARGWQWSGCEPHDGTGTAEKAALRWRTQSLDAIFGWQSLEHCIDPDLILTSARYALRPGGYLVVSVPNRRCLEEWLWQEKWDGWRLTESDPLQQHRWHWTERTLSGLLRVTGFRVQEVLYQRVAKQLPGGVVTGTLLAALKLSSRMIVVARPA